MTKAKRRDDYCGFCLPTCRVKDLVTPSNAERDAEESSPRVEPREI